VCVCGVLTCASLRVGLRSKREVEAKVYMATDFPLTVQQVLPVIDVYVPLQVRRG
jgi:hypothetical protein